jgi:hypothetical protein
LYRARGKKKRMGIDGRSVSKGWSTGWTLSLDFSRSTTDGILRRQWGRQAFYRLFPNDLRPGVCSRITQE